MTMYNIQMRIITTITILIMTHIIIQVPIRRIIAITKITMMNIIMKAMRITKKQSMTRNLVKSLAKITVIITYLPMATVRRITLPLIDILLIITTILKIIPMRIMKIMSFTQMQIWIMHIMRKMMRMKMPTMPKMMIN